MMKIGEMSVGELAAFVCSHLKSRGMDVVLSGGSCVTIYASGKYVSLDLDFVERLPVTRRRLRQALEEIGFAEERRYFVHPETEFFLEFPAGPLAVGGEPVGTIEEMRLATGTLKLLSPTDCVKDRLAAFFHWNDRQCFQQAVWVAQEKAIDWKEIERWSRKEGEEEKFTIFREAFEEKLSLD